MFSAGFSVCGFDLTGVLLLQWILLCLTIFFVLFRVGCLVWGFVCQLLCFFCRVDRGFYFFRCFLVLGCWVTFGFLRISWFFGFADKKTLRGLAYAPWITLGIDLSA